MTFFGISKVGLVREHNEDAIYMNEAKNIFAVADGMGGYAGGDIASEMALDALDRYMKTCSSLTSDILQKAVDEANTSILKYVAAHEEFSGMGTTLSVLGIHAGRAYIAQIGDSRIYLCRNGKLKQMTEDHSMVANLIKKGALTKEEALCHPSKNIITRAVGVEKNVLADITSFEIENGDIFILCSDGITNMVADSRIAEVVMNQEMSIRNMAKYIMELAYDAGANDNASLIIVRI